MGVTIRPSQNLPRGGSVLWVIGAYPNGPTSLEAKIEISMPQATRVWLEQVRMAHHHQAWVVHSAAHHLQDIRGGQTARARLMAMPTREQHQRHQSRSAHNPNMR